MSQSFVIFPTEKAWRVGHVIDGHPEMTTIDGDVLTDEMRGGQGGAPLLVETLNELGYAGQPVVLAPGGASCLCAPISTDGLDRGARRRALSYRLEEHLPISVEDFVADYVEVRPGVALGVCAELAPLREIIEDLQSHDIPVRNACPAALLTAQRLAQEHADAHAILLHGADGYHLILLHRRQLAGWFWLADDAQNVIKQLRRRAEADDQSLQLVTLGIDKACSNQLSKIESLQVVEVDDHDADQLAIAQAEQVLGGGVSAWIDLRQDVLAAPDRYEVYRQPVMALVAALVFAFIAGSGVMLWRAERYGALIDQAVVKQREVFKQALPNQRVPGSIKARLTSEQRRLAGVGGVGSGSGDGVRVIDAGVSTPALLHLQRVLPSLPGSLRYRLLDLSIQPDQIRLDGQARSHAEADRIATALRNTGVYLVEPPKTQALKDRGVSFLFTATPTTPSTKVVKR